MKRFATLLLVLLVFFIGIVGGIVLDRTMLTAFVPLENIPTEANDSFALIAEAWHTITEQYVDQTAVSNDSLAYGAIRGMVDGLGDTGHSRFLSPEELQEQHDYNQGSFEGIGAYVEMRDGFTTIVSPIDNSPAQAAGLQAGDIILAVNGEDVTTLPLDEVVQRVLGPAGSEVTLTIFTPDSEETWDVTLTRARVELQNVTWQQLPGTTVAQIRISAFSQHVSDDLQQALTEIQAQGMTGVILDLRNNPGGLLSEAIGVASQFLPEGTAVLQRQDAQGQVDTEAAIAGGAALDIPLTVLINEGSASASEIVAGALQDAGRATLVGETTFGTGTVLNEFDLSDGSAMLLATEQWLTPQGRLIWHQGITPDEVVALADGERPLQPEASRDMTADELLASGDAQLLQALQLLNPDLSFFTDSPQTATPANSATP
ncbi:MAG: S41 family peptidase [Chloroflexota bacterium]